MSEIVFSGSKKKERIAFGLRKCAKPGNVGYHQYNLGLAPHKKHLNKSMLIL